MESFIVSHRLGNQFNFSTGANNLLFSLFADETSLDDKWDLWNTALSQYLRESMCQSVNDRNRTFGVLGSLQASLVRHQSPDFVDIDDRGMVRIASQVEMTHTDFTKVTWMVHVHVDSMMMLTTSQTTTTWMLPVLAYTTVTS